MHPKNLRKNLLEGVDLSHKSFILKKNSKAAMIV